MSDKQNIDKQSINALRNTVFRDVTKFYTLSNFALIYPILIGEDVLSMSIINYVVTNYSKQLASYIYVNDKIVYINKSYKDQLDEFKKQCFDPFCREPKIYFCYDQKNKKSILTSVAQLNFYKWAVEINLIPFIRENHEQILQHMRLFGAKSTTKSASSASERAKNKVIIVKKINTEFMNDDEN